jgi:hypothetical protein
MPPVWLAQQNGFGPKFSSTGYYEAAKLAQADPNKSVSRLWCSVCGPAHENQMNKKKSKTCQAVWLSKNGFGPAFSSTGYYEACKRAQSDPTKEYLQQWCSVCGPTNENRMKKNQNMLVWLSKNGFGPAFSSTGYTMRLVKGRA